MKEIFSFIERLLNTRSAKNPFFSDKIENSIISISEDNELEIILQESLRKITDEIDDYYFGFNDEVAQRYFFEKISCRVKVLAENCRAKMEENVNLLKSENISNSYAVFHINLGSIFIFLKRLAERITIYCNYAEFNDKYFKCFDNPAPFVQRMVEHFSEDPLDYKIVNYFEGKPLMFDPKYYIEPGHFSKNITIPDRYLFKKHDVNPEARFLWNGTPKEFVQNFSPIVESKKLFVDGSGDRDNIVKNLYGHFIVTTKKGKSPKPVSLQTLISYFKKEARGEVY